MKKLIALLFVLGVGFIVVSLRLSTREPQLAAPRGEKAARASEPDRGQLDAAPCMTAAVAEPLPLPETIAPVAIAPSVPLVKPASQTNATAPADPVVRVQRPKDPLQDPLAREALSFVGVDLDAEEYWIGAINDPTLSAHERKDLIEDLNEDGFPNPRQPTVDDLPLIVSRLFLIEQLAPDAMDQANAEAFLEAYKDLWNMYVRLAGP